MNKHKSIIKLIEILNNSIDSNAYEVIDFWEGDLCAIGLKKGSKLVYISTYNYINQKKLRYDFDFELINDEKPIPLDVIKEVRGCDIDELINHLRSFFEV